MKFTRLDRRLLLNVYTVAYTVPPETLALTVELAFYNKDLEDRYITILEVPEGQTDIEPFVVFGPRLLPPGKLSTLFWNPCLKEGDTLRIKADRANIVSLAGFICELRTPA